MVSYNKQGVFKFYASVAGEKNFVEQETGGIEKLNEGKGQEKP